MQKRNNYISIEFIKRVWFGHWNPKNEGLEELEEED